MDLIPTHSQALTDLTRHITEIQNTISATAAATYIIHNDRIIHESYSGTHDSSTDSRPVDPQSRFNVGSIRKTFLGFAVGLALYEGKINSIDSFVTEYLPHLNRDLLKSTTIRHLLTHTHGLSSLQSRSFAPGTDWKYNNVGVNILIETIEKVYALPLSQLLEERVFSPMEFKETGWENKQQANLVWLGENHKGCRGDEANLFISARELALWGCLHLNKGNVSGRQMFPVSLFEQLTSVLTPHMLEHKLPRNGFFWFVQDDPRALSELGEDLPIGSFQTLGITGCACLVIPEYQTVAVRMYNQQGANPPGYDYLKDIRTFGNLVHVCIKQHLK